MTCMHRAGSCHVTACLGAFAARLYAAATVLHVVLLALFGARVADFRAEFADALREFRSARHFVGRKGAHVSAASIQFDAPHKHPDVVFLQAGARTVFALGDALLTCIDAVLVFFVGHDFPFLRAVRAAEQEAQPSWSTAPLKIHRDEHREVQRRGYGKAEPRRVMLSASVEKKNPSRAG